MTMKDKSIQTAIAPWLTVQNAETAAAFYKSAFGAIEAYRLETPDGPIVRLSVKGAEFWISGGSGTSQDTQQLGGGSVRMILTVDDPATVFAKALEAGASEVFPVGDSHGWRLGRLVDPFGLHWEVGYQLSD